MTAGEEEGESQPHVDGLRVHSCGNFAHIECDNATGRLFFRCYHCQEDMAVETATGAVCAPFRIVTYSASRSAAVAPVRRMINPLIVFDKTLQRASLRCETCDADTPFVFVLTHQADMTFARVCEKCLTIS